MCATASRRIVSLSGLRASVLQDGTMSHSSFTYVAILVRRRRSISQWLSLQTTHNTNSYCNKTQTNRYYSYVTEQGSQHCSSIDPSRNLGFWLSLGLTLKSGCRLGLGLCLGLPCLGRLHIWRSAITDVNTSSFQTCLSWANRMHYATVFFVQSLTSSVQHLIWLLCALLP